MQLKVCGKSNLDSGSVSLEQLFSASFCVYFLFFRAHTFLSNILICDQPPQTCTYIYMHV